MAEVFQVIPIIPKKLKVDAIRLEILNELRKQARATLNEYKKTTRTWKHKPQFEMLIGLTGKDATILVGTDDRVYGFVDLGTRPHRITARRAPRLRFQAGFTAKTTPNVIGSSRGARSGPFVYPVSVMHPGNKPRNFTKIISKKRQRPYENGISAAVKRGARKLF